MQTRTELHTKEAPESVPQAPVCCPVRMVPLSGVPKEKLACCPLPRHISREKLTAAFQAAPQFSQIPLTRLLEEQRGNLRVILLGGSDYSVRQAAVYLTALFQEGKPPEPRNQDRFWEEVGFEELIGPEEPEEPEETPLNRLRSSLAVISPALLDPGLEEGRENRAVRLRLAEDDGQLPLKEAAALLLAAPSGPVLTPRVMERLETLMESDLLIALKPDQIDLELLEELRFTWGFQVCRVGRPDQDYLRRFLRACAEDLLCPIGEQADLDQVIAHTRRCRGAAFCELDLESLLFWAVQRHAPTPLATKDLLFSPFRTRKEGWDQLRRMTGLEEVKDSLRRLLAAAALDSRRRQSGREGRPFCRNLAFSGPPGTGKSTAARLAAQILREEGCGTGRFVEAGREQLIGSYLGETSPMIAELFRRARGGVLFIDEAGALLDGGRDIYACEAVNALVRHMELEPETMVIFATYPGEMERLLTSNPGLSSRVAQVLEFKSYDNGGLWEILQGFAAEEGYPLPQGAQAVCDGCFDALRRRKGPENFGNGREARRLFQGAVEELALRTLEDGGEPEALLLSDLENAARRMEARSGGARGRVIGF